MSPYRKRLRMVAQSDTDSDVQWELIVEPGFSRARLNKVTGGVPQLAALSSHTAVVGFFLMYAVCRGIDAHSVTETEYEATIFCGVMPTPINHKRQEGVQMNPVASRGGAE